MGFVVPHGWVLVLALGIGGGDCACGLWVSSPCVDCVLFAACMETPKGKLEPRAGKGKSKTPWVSGIGFGRGAAPLPYTYNPEGLYVSTIFT